ncbi:MAG: TadE/TadG family type IV pilus assembly protein [Chloroflexota bacterium]
MTERRHGAQALVEFALVVPIFLLLLMTVVVLGLYVFYNQQLENAAREGARFAAVHSASAQCPTVSLLDPILTMKPEGYNRCDAPEDGWPKMTAAARSQIWGMNPASVRVSACWSGNIESPPTPPNADALPGNPWANCTMGGIDPQTTAAGLPCPRASLIPPSAPHKADGDDKASATAALAGGTQQYDTTVTVYACFNWSPPLGGFLFVPSSIKLQAVITEPLQRQQ